MGRECSHLSRFSTKSGSGFLPAAGERGFGESCQPLPRSLGGECESCSTGAAPAAGASGTREQMIKLPGVAAVVITSGPTRGEHSPAAVSVGLRPFAAELPLLPLSSARVRGPQPLAGAGSCKPLALGLIGATPEGARWDRCLPGCVSPFGMAPAKFAGTAYFSARGSLLEPAVELQSSSWDEEWLKSHK